MSKKNEPPKDPPEGQSQDENQIIAERRARLAELRKRGAAFPNDFRREHLAADLHKVWGGKSNEEIEPKHVAVSVAGRVMLKRVMGHQCEKGIGFATEEVLYPKRNLATSVPVQGSETRLVSVRLSDRVPREMIFPVLREIARLRPAAPVRRGQVLIADVLGTGVDVIATRTVE